jgi:hypothetical protein
MFKMQTAAGKFKHLYRNGTMALMFGLSGHAV